MCVLLRAAGGGHQRDIVKNLSTEYQRKNFRRHRFDRSFVKIDQNQREPHGSLMHINKSLYYKQCTKIIYCFYIPDWTLQH